MDRCRRIGERSGPLRIVTTSWDDGHPADLRLADLLLAAGLPATFYVPLACEGRPVMRPREITRLRAGGFEVGAHGVTHSVLTQLPEAALAEEVRGSKQALESILGEPVAMFCYPRGRYDGAVVRCLRGSGYEGARTTRMLATCTSFDPFRMPTTVQAFPHGTAAYVRNLLRGRQAAGLGNYLLRWRRYPSWVELAKALFDQVAEQGGVWHLYGHAWEIEKMNLWDGLRDIFAHVAGRQNFLYLTNGQVTSLPLNSAAAAKKNGSWT